MPESGCQYIYDPESQRFQVWLCTRPDKPLRSLQKKGQGCLKVTNIATYIIQYCHIVEHWCVGRPPNGISVIRVYVYRLQNMSRTTAAFYELKSATTVAIGSLSIRAQCFRYACILYLAWTRISLEKSVFFFNAENLFCSFSAPSKLAQSRISRASMGEETSSPQ